MHWTLIHLDVKHASSVSLTCDLCIRTDTYAEEEEEEDEEMNHREKTGDEART